MTDEQIGYLLGFACGVVLFLSGAGAVAYFIIRKFRQ
jgi:hypothetical protein